ncbi:MAG TPA: NRAMP family divalent metal transporter [Acidimicrobiales bacterium]|nr:NRAMP family divalent metal transporter [Acidimicrobiales bacterium]
MTQPTTTRAPEDTGVLDAEHVGDIRGALGTISRSDTGPRAGLTKKLLTLLAIVGPGLIVMVGDNDAGAFATYTQAGQDYGTRLLWTLPLLIPVLYVAQEMVVRLGAVTGVGHARLIRERFGRFWGAFSVVDLFILNALTLVTEFIGVSLAVGFLGLPKVPSVLVAGAAVVAAASTGSFRRFERVCLVLVAASLLLIPIYVMVHPSTGTMARSFVVPGFPAHAQMSTVLLLVIGIVGTTIAPWQLFFQQSYVIDKRITPRFISYERADLWIGILIVLVGAAAMFGFADATFAGHAGFGHFTDAQGVARGLARYVSPVAGDLFAIALIDASIIGASAVGLSTSYALADAFGFNHSLHRKLSKAKGFYVVFAGLMALSAALVLTPGVPLGLLTEAVQVLSGVLLPSAVVFLVLLCNDREVLGPWVNSRRRNVMAALVVWVLLLVSVILTASVLFPHITVGQIVALLGAGSLAGAVAGLALLAQQRRERTGTLTVPVEWEKRHTWRMPPASRLTRPPMSAQRRLGLVALRAYLVVAFVVVVVKVVQVAVG